VTIISLTSLLLLVIVGGMSQLRLGRSFLARHIDSIFYGTVGLVFTFWIYKSIILYLFWLGNEFGKLYLPPYQGLNYYFITILSRFFAPYIISFFIALLFLYVIRWYNRKYENRFFEKEEYYLAALSVFLVSHPGWILYLFVLFGSYLVFQLFSQIVPKLRGQRIPLYHFWVLSGVFVILITEYVLVGNAFWLRLSI